MRRMAHTLHASPEGPITVTAVAPDIVTAPCGGSGRCAAADYSLYLSDRTEHIGPTEWNGKRAAKVDRNDRLPWDGRQPGISTQDSDACERLFDSVWAERCTGDAVTDQRSFCSDCQNY